MIDPRLQGVYDAMEVGKLALAASLCVRASATWRPTMSEVTTQLLMWVPLLWELEAYIHNVMH